MIKTIKASNSEKILFIFLIGLSIFAFTSFFLLKKALSRKFIDGMGALENFDISIDPRFV